MRLCAAALRLGCLFTAPWHGSWLSCTARRLGAAAVEAAPTPVFEPARGFFAEPVDLVVSIELGSSSVDHHHWHDRDAHWHTPGSQLHHTQGSSQAHAPCDSGKAHRHV